MKAALRELYLECLIYLGGDAYGRIIHSMIVGLFVAVLITDREIGSVLRCVAFLAGFVAAYVALQWAVEASAGASPTTPEDAS